MAFTETGIELEFTGERQKEKGIVAACRNPDCQVTMGKAVVAIDVEYFRPTEVDLLIGDGSKAKRILGWKPKHTLTDLVKEMVESDMERFRLSMERKLYLV